MFFCPEDNLPVVSALLAPPYQTFHHHMAQSNRHM
jgi:hypothetical protein